MVRSHLTSTFYDFDDHSKIPVDVSTSEFTFDSFFSDLAFNTYQSPFKTSSFFDYKNFDQMRVLKETTLSLNLFTRVPAIFLAVGNVVITSPTYYQDYHVFVGNLLGLLQAVFSIDTLDQRVSLWFRGDTSSSGLELTGCNANLTMLSPTWPAVDPIHLTQLHLINSTVETQSNLQLDGPLLAGSSHFVGNYITPIPASVQNQFPDEDFASITADYTHLPNISVLGRSVLGWEPFAALPSFFSQVITARLMEIKIAGCKLQFFKDVFFTSNGLEEDIDDSTDDDFPFLNIDDDFYQDDDNDDDSTYSTHTSTPPAPSDDSRSSHDPFFLQILLYSEAVIWMMPFSNFTVVDTTSVSVVDDGGVGSLAFINEGKYIIHDSSKMIFIDGLFRQTSNGLIYSVISTPDNWNGPFLALQHIEQLNGTLELKMLQHAEYNIDDSWPVIVYRLRNVTDILSKVEIENEEGLGFTSSVWEKVPAPTPIPPTPTSLPSSSFLFPSMSPYTSYYSKKMIDVEPILDDDSTSDDDDEEVISYVGVVAIWMDCDLVNTYMDYEMYFGYQCEACIQNKSCINCSPNGDNQDDNRGTCQLKSISCPSHTEKFGSNCCDNECSDKGTCNKESLVCDCDFMYDGSDCSELSTDGNLVIASSVFVGLISVLSVYYYNKSIQQKEEAVNNMLADLQRQLLYSTDLDAPELSTGGGPGGALSFNSPNGVDQDYIKGLQQGLVLRDVMVDMNEVRLVQKIGEGAFGTVYKAHFREEMVAVKMVNPTMLFALSDEDVENFKREAYVMSRLRHPNIVMVMGISIVEQEVQVPLALQDEETGPTQMKRSLCIITEYLEQGSLYDIIHSKESEFNNIWSYELVLSIALQAARGLLYLHSQKPSIIHRDLKSSNLVVDEHWVVKVTDFGMSRILPEKETLPKLDTRGSGGDSLTESSKDQTSRNTTSNTSGIHKKSNSWWNPFGIFSPSSGIREDDGPVALVQEKDDDLEIINGDSEDHSSLDGGGEEKSVNGKDDEGKEVIAIRDFRKDSTHYIDRGSFGGHLENNRNSENDMLEDIEERKTGDSSSFSYNPTQRNSFRETISNLPPGGSSNMLLTSNLGTYAWAAPEIFSTDNIVSYNLKVDVYSFGMVLWELWERKVPFSHYHQFDIADAVREGKRPQISMNCPPALKTLIRRCWAQSATRRPKFSQIVRILRDELLRVRKMKEKENKRSKDLSYSGGRRRGGRRNNKPFNDNDDEEEDDDMFQRQRSITGGGYEEMAGKQKRFGKTNNVGGRRRHDEGEEEEDEISFRSSEGDLNVGNGNGGNPTMTTNNNRPRRGGNNFKRELSKTWKKFFGGSSTSSSSSDERGMRQSQSDGSLSERLIQETQSSQHFYQEEEEVVQDGNNSSSTSYQPLIDQDVVYSPPENRNKNSDISSEEKKKHHTTTASQFSSSSSSQQQRNPIEEEGEKNHKMSSIQEERSSGGGNDDSFSSSSINSSLNSSTTTNFSIDENSDSDNDFSSLTKRTSEKKKSQSQVDLLSFPSPLDKETNQDIEGGDEEEENDRLTDI